MKLMKTIGMIGGMSWESTVTYYQIVNQVIRRELGGRWAFGVVLWQCGIAWIAALIVRLIGLALGL